MNVHAAPRDGLSARLAQRLFPTWLDGALSLCTLAIVIWLAWSFGRWAFTQADWRVIGESLRFLMAGGLDRAQIWRAWAASYLFLALVGLSLARLFDGRGWHWALGAALVLLSAGSMLRLALDTPLALPLLLFAALLLGWAGARLVTARWLVLAWVAGTIVMWQILIPGTGRAVGGLLLGTLVTVVAALGSFPLGVLLALGRTSRLPGVRMVCSGYIELVRSLPLISILFWAWMVVPLVLPTDIRINDVVRGTAGFVLFYAAYVAEYVRGGLQGIPAGQWGASWSLGMTTAQTLRHVILPQAIRTVLPGLVGNVLDIFNNVPLLFIIGLTEFVRAGQVVLSNPQHSDQLYEVYVFMFAVYLLIAMVLSWSARVVEQKGRAASA